MLRYLGWLRRYCSAFPCRRRGDFDFGGRFVQPFVSFESCESREDQIR